MHPDTERLLDLRDGAGDAATAAHVAECQACATELARLHAMRAGLQALPALAPPERVWERVRARRRRPSARWYFPSLAIAATVVMAVALTMFMPGDSPLPGNGTGARLATLAAESDDLERLLAGLDADRRVMDLQTAGTVIALEDRIAAVDGRLRYATLASDEAEALWQQRVELMRALVSVHATSGGIEF